MFGTAGCNRSVPGLLSDSPARASTGSVVSTIGAALGRAPLAKFPVSAGCDTSLVGWLRAAAVVVSTGSVVSTTGAAFARASLATLPVGAGCDASLVGWLTAAGASKESTSPTTGRVASVPTARRVGATGSTGAIAPTTSLLSVPTVSLTVVSTGCTAAS